MKPKEKIIKTKRFNESMINENQFILYQSNNHNVAIDVVIGQDTIWATQKSMAELFNVQIPAIAKHLKNIFDTGELDKNRTVSKMEIVQNEGDRKISREVTFYNLDAIISVGYRVNSIQATEFRKWATKTLNEYMIKGFVLDDERLKQGSNLLDKDYFDELLERVRSIRASERRIWQKITDIFQEISSDYDKNSPITRNFYATVQNKFHYAISGQTGAEIIYNHADKDQPHMGLTTWKNAPDGRILKSDAMVAKNYLTENQIKSLERNVSGYFDYVEDLLERRHNFTMQDFVTSIDRFLEFREYDVLTDNGHVSMVMAKDKASREYQEFNKHQKIESDFDKQVKKMLNNPDK